MKDLTDRLDYKVSQCRFSFFGKLLNDVEHFINTDRVAGVNDSFGRCSPSGRHDFLSGRKVFDSREQFSSKHIEPNDCHEVEQERLFLKECKEGSSSKEGKLKQVHCAKIV